MFKKIIILLTLSTLNFMAYASSMQDQPAPSFNLQDQSGEYHQLSDYQDQWLVIYFYPKNDTTGCTIEAKAFRDHHDQLQAMNTDVLGVSMDDAASHRAFIDKYDLPFNLLVDADKNMSRDYGVDGGMAFFSYAKRQTFIINPEGVIARHFEEVNPSTHVPEVLKALNELQAAGQAKASVAVVTEATDDWTVYGAEWPEVEPQALPLAQAMSDPVQHVDQDRLLTGSITRVCQKKGCWMILADGDDFLRVDFNDHAFLIPKDSSGQAHVMGHLVAKELTAEQIAHYESEGAEGLKSKQFEIVADSVKILN
jgi:peroxiredoxin Q/BCP